MLNVKLRAEKVKLIADTMVNRGMLYTLRFLSDGPVISIASYNAISYINIIDSYVCINNVQFCLYKVFSSLEEVENDIKDRGERELSRVKNTEVKNV
jgi:hypothetical protein